MNEMGNIDTSDNAKGTQPTAAALESPSVPFTTNALFKMVREDPTNWLTVDDKETGWRFNIIAYKVELSQQDTPQTVSQTESGKNAKSRP